MANDTQDTKAGLFYALSAYSLWGLLPIYMDWLAQVNPIEVVAHRVIWSVPVALLVLMVQRRTRDVAAALRNPRMLGMAAVTAGLISINWAIYVWSVGAGRVIDTALGYYINPLFSIVLAALLLGERLTRAQMVAVGLAAVAVIVLTVQAGSLPVSALALTVTFGFYAFFKRWLSIGPNQGFLLEVLILTPAALAYILWAGITGRAAFLAGPVQTDLLLVGCGVVTAVPLMFYANGAKGLRLSTIGILQYVAPTMIFLVAVFVLGETMDPARRIAFPLIWAALVIYTWSMLRGMRKGS